MTTIKEAFAENKKFGMKDCKNPRIAVKLDFECSHPPQAFSILRKILDGVDNYEVRFNEKECVVLMFPEDISLNTKKEDVDEEFEWVL